MAHVSQARCITLSRPLGKGKEGGVYYSIRIHCVKSNVYFFWSEPVNTSLVHEHFLGVPGCGDVTLHLEKLANTTHVYVEPLSKVEVSAKEIRARIQSTPTMSRYASDHYFLPFFSTESYISDEIYEVFNRL